MRCKHPASHKVPSPPDPLGSTEEPGQSTTHGESETGATERAAPVDKMEIDSEPSKPETVAEAEAPPRIPDLTVSPRAAHKLLKVSQLLNCITNVVLPLAGLQDRLQSAQPLFMPQWWNCDLDVVLLEAVAKWGLWCGDMAFLEDKDHPFYTGCEKEGRGAMSVSVRQRVLKEFLCHTPPLLLRLEYLCILALDSVDSPNRATLETHYPKQFAKIWKGGPRAPTEWGDEAIYLTAPRPLEESAKDHTMVKVLSSWN